LRRITRRGLSRRILGFGRGVYVVGMHRSGTSAVTRTVNLMGIPLSGARDLVGPVASSNPTGHWESGALLDVNDRILARLGGAWSAPPNTTLRWERDQELNGLRRDARRSFADSYRTRQWLWKDPRLCLTLPFWRTSIPAKALAILVIRHPMEIARSLEARDRFPVRYSLALWERYLRTALDGVTGMPVLVTPYDALLADPVAWCDTVFPFLARHGLHVSRPDAGALAAFLDPALRHSAVGREGQDGLADVVASQRRLYQVLQDLVGSHESLERPMLPPEEPGTEALLAAHRDEFRRTGDQWRVPAG
jgi:hypothetical protein